MKIKYEIAATLEGNLDELINAKPVEMPTLTELLATMAELAFIVETVAHLQGKERQLLPSAEKARALIAKLEGGAA